ncbi:uncharacterized protein LY89DRAFT_668872 [Mollisia scopiformis]|uniref:Uncharacterized protein n=1 Tax=Mollisia scopiformis TaxID=149040 RepID=A0A194XBL5_MOLSC|nr:uncharacterized protein LY89DRAFT_668872 [Mollisia scopiformis]KUJ17560.1 hypothetical protein LY89DRAFT_668872 [Mollisia scopiformis]
MQDVFQIRPFQWRGCFFANTSNTTKIKQKSKRKHSKADSYNSLPPQPELSEAYEEESVEETWPPPSFLFTINELPVNDEPTQRTIELLVPLADLELLLQGGEPPRVDEYGNWHPPIRSNGFGTQVPSRIYRWADGGRVSAARECQWFNNQWWSQAGNELTEYRASTMFWCNNFTQFLVATGDASRRHMEQSIDPHNRWWPLTFRHESTLSRVEEVGQEGRLAGSGTWINALGLTSYRNRHTVPAGGLAGNLAIMIGLIAFSCESTDLDTVLLTDRAWRRGRWHDHGRIDGRIDERGVVVTIYHDPENTQGSTNDTIFPLEWTGAALLH